MMEGEGGKMMDFGSDGWMDGWADWKEWSNTKCWSADFER